MTHQELIQKTLNVLNQRVKIDTQPIAIKMLNKTDPVPEKTKSPSKMGQAWALCQGFFAARSLGMISKFTKEDQACPVAQIMIGFEKEIPFYTEGNISQGMFTETLEGGKNSEEVLPKFEFGKYDGILIGPLEKFIDITPDVIIIYGSPGQIVRILQGALYKEGGNIESSFTGRAGCIPAIASCMKNQQCQVLLNGNGERVFGHAQDNEMSFAIPWSKLEEVVEGIEQTHKGGVRYPYPAFITYTPQFPKKYRLLTDMFED